VQVFGAQKYAVRVQLDPHALNSLGVGIDEVGSAINNSNVNLPTGIPVGHRSVTATVQATGQLQNATEFGNLIVTWRDWRARAAQGSRPGHRRRAEQ
jgi:HAE1 family hydrophobic/amphiphilic exporter-1